MRLPIDPRLPVADDIKSLKRRLYEVFRDIAQQVNGVSEGSMAAWHSAQTAAPTQGKHARGDFVYNSAPQELGAAGSKYVIHGWQCVAAGEPGSWVQCRFLTGN